MSIDRYLFCLIIIGVMIAAVLTITIMAIWRDYSRRRQVLAGLKKDSVGGRNGFPREGSRSGWNYRIVTSNRYRELAMVPPLRICIACSPPFFLLLRRKHAVDQLFGRSRFFHSIQTGDPEFDQSLSVISFEWNPGAVEQWLNDPGQRVLLKKLVAMGCEHIRFDCLGITVTWKWNNLKRRQGANKALNITLDHLVSIADFLSHRFPVSAKGQRRSIWHILLPGIPLALLVIGEIGCLLVNSWCRPLDWGRVDMRAALYSLPLLIGYLFYLVPWLKIRASSYIVWLAIVGMAYGGFWFTGRSLLAGVNAVWDTRPGVWRDSLVLRKEIDFMNKDLTLRKCMLHTTSWRGHDEEVIPVTTDIFDAARPGHDYLQLLLRPGRLDYTWISAMRLRPKQTVAGGSLRAVWDRQQAGDLQGAESGYDAYIETHPDDAHGFYYRGRLYGGQKNFSASLADIRHAIQLDPHYFKAYLYLDWLLSREAQWDEIILSWSRLIRLEPRNARALRERAGSYWHRGNRQHAIQDLRQACDLGERKACADLKFVLK